MRRLAAGLLFGLGTLLGGCLGPADAGLLDPELPVTLPAAVATPEAAMSTAAEVGAYVAKVHEVEWYRGVLDSIMHDHWLRIGRCEQPGSDYGGIDWDAYGSTAHGTFAGGLGIHIQAWAENSAGYPASALDASPFEQMAVATRIFQRFGAGAWACR